MNEHKKMSIAIYTLTILISMTIILGSIDKHFLKPLDDLNYSKEKINHYSYYVNELPVPDIWNMTTVEKSFDKWTEKNPELEFYEVDSTQDADIVIVWDKEVIAYDGDDVDGLMDRHHDGILFATPRNFIIVDYIEECANDDDDDEVYHHYNKYRIENIITHEIGHALGLGHSSDRSSIMYASDGIDDFDSMGLTIPKDVYQFEEWYSHELQILSEIREKLQQANDAGNNTLRTQLVQEHDILYHELKCNSIIPDWNLVT